MKKTLLNFKIVLTMIVFMSAIGFTLNAQQLPKVAIITADWYGGPGEQQLVLDLEATGRFELVDFWNATPAVDTTVAPPGVQPTLAEIMEYDAVLIASNSSLTDPITLGNDMDAFAQAGGGVVLAPYSMDNGGLFGTLLQGSWENGQWDIVQNHDMNFLFTDCYTGIGTIYEPESPLVQGIETVEFSQYGGCFISDPPLVDGAVRVADMEAQGGLPLIYRHDSLPNRVDLGCRPTVAQSCTYSGFMSGGANLIANCLEYVCDFTIGLPDIQDNGSGIVLDQNFPNPFRNSTKISYTIPEGLNQRVSLNVYNLQGQLVTNLVDEVQSGSHEVTFNAGYLNSGMYYYTLNTGGFTQTRKFIIEK